jgi:carbamoyltransferase
MRPQGRRGGVESACCRCYRLRSTAVIPPQNIPSGSTLGINYTCMHDAAVAVVGPQGDVVFACALERISRVKQDGRWPQALLDGLLTDRIDAIAVGSLQFDDAVEHGRVNGHDLWPARLRQHAIGSKPLPYPPVWNEAIAGLPAPVTFFDHHHAHAASAYYLAGMESALVITCDAGAHNCPWHFAAYRAHGDVVQPIAGLPYHKFLAPAHVYTLVTCLIGLRPNRHEGKVTGLAARGKVTAAELLRFEAIAWPMSDWMGELLEWDMCLGVDNAPTVVVNESVRKRWRREFAEFSDEQLAACAQATLEHHVLAMVDHARDLAGEPFANVCLAGGVFANVLLNQKVIKRFDGGFVAPPMTDDGVALGAALLEHVARHPDASPRRHRATMYLGPDLEPADALLRQHGIGFTQPTDLADEVAMHLADGRIVAVARGRMEFGPRALGHRSVLAPATDPSVNDNLNKRLRRSEFMPFAPIILTRDAADLIEDADRFGSAARFMTVTVDCKQTLVDEAPAIVHLDGTARPQLVDPLDEPFCARVLEQYARRSGRRALVNTSFNVHEEPIVCTVEDALLGFAQTQLDFLCLGDNLIPFAGNEAALERFVAAAAAEHPATSGDLNTVEALGRWLERRTAKLAELARRIGELEARVGSLTAERDAAEQRAGTLAEEVDRAHAVMSAQAAQVLELDDLRSKHEDMKRWAQALDRSLWCRLGRGLRVIGGPGT